MGPQRWAGQLIKLSDLNQREASVSSTVLQLRSLGRKKTGEYEKAAL